jgi:hypothetical protein
MPPKTKRIPDPNGWIEIKDNPLTVAGVFEYRGETIGLPSAEPGKAYGVLRAEEELSDPESVASARLIPWTNDHPEALLGPDGIPAEDKGVDGVTGEEIYYKGGTLYGNIKVFTESLADDIRSGKRELSMGYSCEWVPDSGTYHGKPYQFRQKRIRYNHVSLVDKGRMGPGVAVLDSKAPPDTPQTTTGETGMDPFEQLKVAINALTQVAQYMQQQKGGKPGGAEPEGGGEPAEPAEPAADEVGETGEAPGQEGDEPADGAETPEKENEQAKTLMEAAGMITRIAKEEAAAGGAPETADEKEGTPPAGEEGESKDEGEEGKKCAAPAAMDAETIYKTVMAKMARTQKRAARAAPFVGAMDSSQMDEADVAVAFCRKIPALAKTPRRLACVAMDSYLAAAPQPKPVSAVRKGAMDTGGKSGSSFVDKYLNPTKE